MSGTHERNSKQTQVPPAVQSSTLPTIPAKRKATENPSPPASSSSNATPRSTTPHLDFRRLSVNRDRGGQNSTRNASAHRNPLVPRHVSGSIARSETGNERIGNAYTAKLLPQTASSSRQRSSPHTANPPPRPVSAPNSRERIAHDVSFSVVDPTSTSFLPPKIHDYRQLVNPHRHGAGSKDAPITLSSSDEEDEDPTSLGKSSNRISSPTLLDSSNAQTSPARAVVQNGGAARPRAANVTPDVQEIPQTNHLLGPTMSLLQAARGIQTRAYPQQAQPTAPVHSTAPKASYRIEKHDDREVCILDDSDDEIMEIPPPSAKSKLPAPSPTSTLSPVQILSSGSSRESSQPVNDVSASSPTSRSSPAGSGPLAREAVEVLLPGVADLSIDSGGPLNDTGVQTPALPLLSQNLGTKSPSPSKHVSPPNSSQTAKPRFTRYQDMMHLMGARPSSSQTVPSPLGSPLNTKPTSRIQATPKVPDHPGPIATPPLSFSKPILEESSLSISTCKPSSDIATRQAGKLPTKVSPSDSSQRNNSISLAKPARNPILPGLSGSMFAGMNPPTGFEEIYKQNTTQPLLRVTTARVITPPIVPSSISPEPDDDSSANVPIQSEDSHEDVFMDQDDPITDRPSQNTLPPAGLSADKAAVVAEIMEITEEMAKLMNRPSYKTEHDIPKEIYPYMNAMTPEERKSGNAKRIFEALMAEDEDPNVPPIKLYNYVDDEVSPAFEFIYSNKMYYASDIPGPDYENLKGCECVGGCDPSNDACSCLRRQEYWTADHSNDDDDFRFEGFGYNERGQLKDRTYPIFECNINCGCDATCINRVVQHGRQVELNIVKTARKGWGVFAGPNLIPTGTFLGIYAGELMGTDLAEKLGLSKYTAIQRTYVLDIDNWFLSQRFKPYSAEGFHAMPPPPPEDPSGWEAEYCVDAFRVANWTRFINHSCEPNAHVQSVYVDDADFRKPLICLFAHGDIPAREEICFSYHGLEGAEEKQDEALAARSAKGVDHNLVQACHCGAKTCRGLMFR